MNVAVVLTHTRIGDLPSREGAARLEVGRAMLADGAADLLLIGGGLPGRDGRSLAEVYRDHLVRTHGVDPDRIILETKSRDTAETLRFIPRVLEAELGAPLGQIFLISNPNHLRRALRTIAALSNWGGVSLVSSPETTGLGGAVKERLLDVYAMVDPRWESRLAELMRRRRERMTSSVLSGARATVSPPSKRPLYRVLEAVHEAPARRAETAAGPSRRGTVVAAVPCFNEAPYIGPIVRQLHALVDVVVVVDDGSTDDTARLAREAGAHVICHGTNRGYGAAIRSCFEASIRLDADVLVTLDGDGQHDPGQIPDLIRPLGTGAADMVIGSRYLGEFSGIPGYRRVGIAIITGLFNAGAAQRVTDAQSGYRAYRKEILEALAVQETGMGASVEILVKARAAGFRIAEVPITCSYHASSSTHNPVRHGVGVAWKVLEHRAEAAFFGRHGHAGSRKKQ